MIGVRLLTHWNSKRVAAEFTRREIYPLDHHAVDGLLAGLGAARPSTRRERGPAYERSRPNELWHIDIKGPFFLRRSAREYEKVRIVCPMKNSASTIWRRGIGTGARRRRAR